MKRLLALSMASRVYRKLSKKYKQEVKRLFDEKLYNVKNDTEREEIILAREKALTHKTDLRRSARLGVAVVASVVKGYWRGNIFPSDDVLNVGTYLEQIVSGADIDDEADDEKSTLTPLQYRANKIGAKYLIESGESGLESLGLIEEYDEGKSAVLIGQNIDLEFGRLLKEGKYDDIFKRKDEFVKGWEQKIGRRGIAYWLSRVAYDGVGGKSDTEKEIVSEHLGNCGQIWQVGDDIKDLIDDVKAFDDPSAEIVPANSIVIDWISRGFNLPINSYFILSYIEQNFWIVEDLYKKYKEVASDSLKRWSESGIKGSTIYASGALDYTSHKVVKRMEDLRKKLKQKLDEERKIPNDR